MVPYFFGSLDGGDVIFPGRFQREKEAMGASLEISLRVYPHKTTRTKDPFESEHHVPDNSIWNASESTLSPCYLTGEDRRC